MPLRMPSLARRSSPAAADQSHTPYSPPTLLPSPPVLALTCWARCGAGFAQLYSTCGLLTWALAHVGGAPPTPISRPRSAVAVDHPVQDPVQDPVQKIPCEIPCKRSRARSVAIPPPPLAAASTPSVAAAAVCRTPPSVTAAGHLHHGHLPLRRRPAKHASYHAPPFPQDHPSLVVVVVVFIGL